MDREFVIMGERVAADKYLIAQLINEETIKSASAEELEQYAEFLNLVIERRAGFIELLGKSLQNYINPQEVFEEISRWGEATGNYFLEQGMAIDDALAETSLYRKHIGKVIKTEARHRQIPMDYLFEAMEFFHSLLDHAAYSYSSAYISSYQKKLASARKEFLELSAPVVPISDQIAVLPLVGEIELDRAQFILEKTLLSANRLRISTLIIDLSGVVKVDSMVAEQIVKIVMSLKLVGVKAVLTGIRPEIAITLANLGIDIKDLEIGGSLKQALENRQ